MTRPSTMRVQALALLLSAALAAPAARALPPPGADAPPRPAARPSPSWVRDAVIYEVFPRAFSPEGTFAGITARLDELRDLGVTVLWLMPIHPVGKKNAKGSVGSPYAVRDYYAINPAYGTAGDLHRLVGEAHRRGLKVIIDIVANHTSWDSVLMKTPAFYVHDAAGRIVPPEPGWADVAQLDYRNPELRRYMIGVLKYWLLEFDLDGFRCDVAGRVPTDFWEQARSELESLRPAILMLAEANAPGLLVKAFDLDYDWPLFHAVDAIVQGGAPASTLREVWTRERDRFPSGALQMRFTDDHDERRAIARLGERAALAASAFVLTTDGVPLLYNGMEAGDTTESTAPALFERLPVFWSIAERRPEFPRFYREMIALRRAHPALRQGDTEWLGNSDEERVVTYLRRTPAEELLVAVNLSSRPWDGTVALGRTDGFADVTPDPGAGTPSLPALSLPAWGYRVLWRAVR